jgi:hypothetical protein
MGLSKMAWLLVRAVRRLQDARRKMALRLKPSALRYPSAI